MPNNKILFTLIICFGIVASVYLLARDSTDTQLTKNVMGVFVNPYVNLDKNANNDWKKILVSLDLSNSTTTILNGDNSEIFDDTTLTGQMSRDFLSQYLLTIKNEPITVEKSAEIAEGILSIPGYTTISGAKYLASNLHIITKSDPNTLQAYENALNLVLKERSSQMKSEPTSVFRDAINSASETKLAKLDPIISLNKSFLMDLLNMNVPEKAVKVHLALMNASSNLLSDLEGMRVVFVDPVRSLAAAGQYQKHLLELKTSLDNLYVFFAQN